MRSANERSTERAYAEARERYAKLGVDTDRAIETLMNVSISIPCWQGDDVRGFETATSAPTGGIVATGNYPGRARNPDELRADMAKALSLIPGNHRVNLHAIYGEFGGKKVERDDIGPEHFSGWVEWARETRVGLDFNATCFSHPKAQGGFTLSHKDIRIRKFWIEHVKRCRETGAYFGRSLGNPCVHNLWIPDGSKDDPADRLGYRQILVESLDEIYSVHYEPDHLKDSLEPKLFGIGSESYVVGSHEFYMGYALTRGKMLCLDTGHFHPTESVADKIPALLLFFDELLLHLSRGVRWDSDHVVILSDELLAVARETVRANALQRVHIALDFFDASINRVAAWVIGARAVMKAFLFALLEPTSVLREYEDGGWNFARLGLLDDARTMPFGAVWDRFCLVTGVPVGHLWINEITAYERDVLSKRG